MIFLLYGDDTYRSWQKLQGFIQKYVGASAGDTDLATLEGATLTIADFKNQIHTLPFLAKSRLVVIKNILREGKKEVAEAIVEELPKLPKTTVLLFYEAGQPDKRTRLFQALNKPKQAQEFAPLVGPALVQQAESLAEQEKITIVPPALQQLLQLTGSDLWRLTQEITKLALYKPGGRITAEDIELLVGGQAELKIFDLTDAFGQRQSAKAQQLLKLVDQEESSLGLLAMIAGHYRNLLLIADGQRQNMPKPIIATAVKMHPFAFDKAFAQARQYTYDELVTCYHYLLELDLAAKQSIIDPLIGLTVLADSLEQKPLQLPAITEENVLY